MMGVGHWLNFEIDFVSRVGGGKSERKLLFCLHNLYVFPLYLSLVCFVYTGSCSGFVF